MRFNSHLISIWHRESSKQKSIDAMLQCVLEELPSELAPKSENYFYKKHSEHQGFKLLRSSRPSWIPKKLAKLRPLQKLLREAFRRKGQRSSKCLLQENDER